VSILFPNGSLVTFPSVRRTESSHASQDWMIPNDGKVSTSRFHRSFQPEADVVEAGVVEAGVVEAGVVEAGVVAANVRAVRHDLSVERYSA